MRQAGGKKKREVIRYSCSNPNCKSVFSKPKKLVYYVCPTCQTLVKMETAQGKEKTKKHGPTEEDLKRKEAERIEAEQKAERSEAERLEAERKIARLEAERKAERLEAERKAKRLESERLKAEQKAERLEAQQKEEVRKVKRLEAERLKAERKAERLEEELKAERLETERKEAERLEAERKETEKRQQVKSKTPKPIEPSQTEQPAAVAAEVNKPSDSGCKHYFGYLGDRKKGEGIPDGCLDCTKSLDCMLSDYYKSKEPVDEIRKWYPTET